jgi:hypothetical protein
MKTSFFVTFALFSVLALSAPANAQAQHHPRSTVSQAAVEEALEAPARYDELRFHPFDASSATATGATALATLITSWIPGEDHKGMMRYKLRIDNVVIPGYEDGGGALSEQNYVKEQTQLFFTLVRGLSLVSFTLFDKDGFTLRDRTVPLSGSTDNGVIVALDANSYVSMSQHEYEQVSKWTIGWTK